MKPDNFFRALVDFGAVALAFVLIMLLLLLAFPEQTRADDWSACAKNIESYLQLQGKCGASNCSDKGRTYEQVVVDECGYPKKNAEDRANLVEAVAEECTLPRRGPINCPMYILRQFEFFPPTDPVHTQIFNVLVKKIKN